MIWGDSHRSLGSLQISKKYFLDSRVSGSWLQVTNIARAAVVMESYLKRFCPDAVKSNNFEEMSRCHNSGPNWRNKKKKTNVYWTKIKNNL